MARRPAGRTPETTRPLYRHVGAVLANRRRDLGLTQVELGKRVGLSRAAIASIECGNQRVFLDTFMDLDKALQPRSAER